MSVLEEKHRRRAPNFIILGAAKAGTTTLYDDIASCKGFCMPSYKEPDILHKASNKVEAGDMYEEHFSTCSSDALCGEASTYYTMLPTCSDVSTRARAVAGPNLRLIYIIRDPIDRILSHLAHDAAVGRLKHMDFDRAVREDPRYVAWSDYAMQLRPWIAAFGLQQIQCLSFDFLISDRAAALSEVLRHIGGDPVAARPGSGISNRRGTLRQSRLALIDQIVRSQVYQHRLRPLLPNSTLRIGKALLTRRRVVPEIVLSSDTQAWLAHIFASQDAELAALGIETARRKLG